MLGENDHCFKSNATTSLNSLAILKPTTGRNGPLWNFLHVSHSFSIFFSDSKKSGSETPAVEKRLFSFWCRG